MRNDLGQADLVVREAEVGAILATSERTTRVRLVEVESFVAPNKSHHRFDDARLGEI
jgi:hypothetical protein